jgi:hypothetical protein
MFWLLATTFRALQFARQREDRAGIEPLTVSLLIQGYLLFLGLLDPTFQKIVFWCFYGIALLLQCAALELEGHTPDDPVSRLLNKLICLCAPPLDLMWSWAAKLLSRLRRNSAEKK